MGWERKRGAIVEFTNFLCGAGETSFTTICGDVSLLPNIKYVITLDADTVLPIGTAKEMIGTIAHPLCRAELNSAKTAVINGYGLIQPRIAIDIESANKSLFSRIFGGQ